MSKAQTAFVTYCAFGITGRRRKIRSQTAEIRADQKGKDKRHEMQKPIRIEIDHEAETAIRSLQDVHFPVSLNTVRTDLAGELRQQSGVSMALCGQSA